MTTPAPLFSIVVPTWNTGAKITHTIQSLLNQDYPRSQYEIIVVDDGSTDDTVDYLKSFSSQIRLFQQRRSGSASARNRGIHQARGEFIVCCDHDDMLFPHALTVYNRALDAFEHPPVLLAQPIFVRTDGAIKVPAWRPASVECIKCKDFFATTVSTAVLNSVFIFRKAEVVRAGGYSGEVGSYDDHDLLFKLGTAGPMVKIMHPVTVAYRLHGRNWTRDPEAVAQGAMAFIRNERRGAYPGGSKRRLERRGLIGGNVLWLCADYYLKARHFPLHVRLTYVTRLLLHARGMIVAAVVRKLRKQYSRFYAQEARSLDSSGRDVTCQPPVVDVNPRNRTAYEAWLSGSISGDGEASAER